MCFSSTASFGAGVILSACGIIAVKNVSESRQYLFAAIPLLFAAQQFTEGVLWLKLESVGETVSQNMAKMLFLLFAQVVWPVWAPLSIRFLEKDKKRKKILSVLTIIGLLISGYLLFCLLNFETNAKILNHHISYQLMFPPALVLYCGALYLLVTIVPLFVSSVSNMNYIGFAIFISYIVTKIVYDENLISVWCFFAAIISGMIVRVIRSLYESRYKENTIQINTN